MSTSTHGAFVYRVDSVRTGEERRVISMPDSRRFLESCSAWCCSSEKGVGGVTPVRGTMALLSSLYGMKEENQSQAQGACVASSAQMLCSGPFKASVTGTDGI